MENHSHRDIQQKLINKLILLFAIIAVPITAFSLYRNIDIGFQPIFVIHCIATVFIILFANFRESLPYAIKVVSLLVFFYILGIASSINLGIGSFFIELMMLTILIGVIFWGKRQAVFIFITSSAVILIVAVLITKGIVSPKISMDTYQLHFSSWMAILAGFAFVAALTILVVGEIGYLLSDKITELQEKNDDLQIAKNEIRRLQGTLSICSNCKKIRDRDGDWNQVESYIEKHSEAQFSHGMCEKCIEKIYGDQEWYQKKE